MRKEIYKIKCPKHIIFGDPQYFEEFKGAELKRLTVDYKPSEYFDTARLVLQESMGIGMTDPFAVEQFQKLFIPKGWTIK